MILELDLLTQKSYLTDRLLFSVTAVVGLILGAAFTNRWLSFETISIMGVADEQATVSIGGKYIGTLNGAKIESIRASLARGQKLRVVGEDSGGSRGICLLVLDSGGQLLAGTTPHLESYWKEIDEKTGDVIGPANRAHQAWGKAMERVTGHDCYPIWGKLNKNRVVLETTPLN